jgi:hypothetical protein
MSQHAHRRGDQTDSGDEVTQAFQCRTEQGRAGVAFAFEHPQPRHFEPQRLGEGA